MDVQIPHTIKEPRQILAFAAKKKKMKPSAIKKLFDFVFKENKNPTREQCLKLLTKYKV